MPNIEQNGAEGAAGGNGFNFTTPAATGNRGHDADCNPWPLGDECAGEGGTGGDGLQGGQGGIGGPGAPGSVIDIELDSYSALISMSANGGVGGKGGDGGKGQDGGKGGDGGNGEDCEYGLNGGSGGNGGNAGVGGKGGPGGKGGTIVARFKQMADGGASLVTSNAGGGGQGGQPGVPGALGMPGDFGDTTGFFLASNDCSFAGIPGAKGNNGVIPEISTLGNGESGGPGAVQLLQIPQ